MYIIINGLDVSTTMYFHRCMQILMLHSMCVKTFPYTYIFGSYQPQTLDSKEHHMISLQTLLEAFPNTMKTF